MQFRTITPNELKIINSKISKFGARQRITQGSVENTGNNKIRYNIGFGDANTYRSEAMLKAIGQRVKDIMQADEVYHNGIQIA